MGPNDMASVFLLGDTGWGPGRDEGPGAAGAAGGAGVGAGAGGGPGDGDQNAGGSAGGAAADPQGGARPSRPSEASVMLNIKKLQPNLTRIHGLATSPSLGADDFRLRINPAGIVMYAILPKNIGLIACVCGGIIG